MKKLATLLVSVVLCLALGEAAVRALGIAPELAPLEVSTASGAYRLSDDPKLVYEPKPGFGDFNRYGLRDRERDVAKTDAVRRIVVLGDSVAFGFCSARRGTIAIDDLFTTRLERALGEGGEPIEVLNLAVSGYNTAQETIFFERKGLALSPDLVVVAYVLNDHLDRAQELAAFEELPDFAESQRLRRALQKNALLHSALARTVWYRLRAADDPDAGLPPLEYRHRVASDLLPLRDLSREHGFEVIVAVFPALSHYARGVYRLAERHDAAVAASRSLGFETLDLLPPFLDASEGKLQRLRGRCTAMHLDEHGHAVAARVLHTHLAERGFGTRGR